MNIRTSLALAALTVAPALYGQVGHYIGVCSPGAARAVTQGLPSTNLFQSIVPSCTVTVYQAGTSTLATIYADALQTPLANPFTASAQGIASFYGAGALDVTMSGVGMATTTQANALLSYLGPPVVLNPTASQTITNPLGTTTYTSSLNNVFYSNSFLGSDPGAKLQAALDYVRYISVNLPNSCVSNTGQCGVAAEIHVPLSPNGAEQLFATPITVGYYAGQSQRLRIVFDGGGCLRYTGSGIGLTVLGLVDIDQMCLLGTSATKALIYTGETAGLHMRGGFLAQADSGDLVQLIGTDNNKFDGVHFRGRLKFAVSSVTGYPPNANHFLNSDFDTNVAVSGIFYGALGQNNTWVSNQFESTPMTAGTTSGIGNVFSANYGEGGPNGMGYFDTGWLIEGNTLTYATLTAGSPTMTLRHSNTVFGNSNGAGNTYLAHITSDGFENVFLTNQRLGQTLVDPTSPSGSFVDLLNPAGNGQLGGAPYPTSIGYDSGAADGVAGIIINQQKCLSTGCQSFATAGSTFIRQTTTPGVGITDQVRSNGVHLLGLHTPTQGELCTPGDFTQDGTYDYKCDSANHWTRRVGGYVSF